MVIQCIWRILFPEKLAAEPPEGLEPALVPRREEKLVKVWLKSGGEAWTPVHVGVQAQKEGAFPFRPKEIPLRWWCGRTLRPWNTKKRAAATAKQDSPEQKPLCGGLQQA